MEKFSRILGTTYFFTDKIAEVPKNILEKVQKTSNFNPATENLIAICFVDQMGSRGDIFVLVTESRVIAKKATGLGQNYFKDLTGVERSITQDIVLLSPGNKSDCFFHMNMPNNDLLDKMFSIINNQWMQFKNNSSSSSNENTASDIPAQIEKLAKLKEQGILTEEEFSKKKSDLLARM